MLKGEFSFFLFGELAEEESHKIAGRGSALFCCCTGIDVNFVYADFQLSMVITIFFFLSIAGSTISTTLPNLSEF